MIAGAIAVVATAGAALAPGLVVAGIGSATTIASIATVVAGVSNIGSQALAHPPPARGSVTQMLIDPNAPQPYVMGEGHFAGVLRFDAGYGATIDDVPNPYRAMAVVYSGGGPVQSISPRTDFAAISSWYSGYLTTDTQLGACPEADALAFSFGTPTGWGSGYKLSGQAAIGWNFKFDKKGKKFASGLPVLGAYGQWVKVYDPRLDSTFPGGSGAHRLGDETTYEYSDNPALHAGTYAFGRYQNGVRTFGCGLPAAAIDWETIAAWANVCDTNGWAMFGVVYEPGDRWRNLRDICMAGGAEPIPGGILSFRYSAPVVALDTIGEDDLAEGTASVRAMQSYRDRLNTIVPQYRSPAHNWEIVSAEAVQVASYLAEDGEERREEIAWNFVKSATQAAQLAAYRVVDGRELSPIVLPLLPTWRTARPGECYHLNLPRKGLDTDAVLLKREIDPATLTVTCTFIGETTSKHAYALGLSGTAPPTPALGMTPQQRDEVAAGAVLPPGYITAAIIASYPIDADPPDGLVQADDTGASCTIAVESFSRVYPTLGTTVSVTGTGGSPLTTEDDGSTAFVADGAHRYHVYYDDGTAADTAPTFYATQDSSTAANSDTNPSRHYVGSVTPQAGVVTNGTGAAPSGWDPADFCVADDTPVLLAAGVEIPAALLEPGTMLRTRHEHTLEWGEFPVAAIAFIEAEVFACRLQGANGAVTIRATGDHRFWIGNEWARASEIGASAGTARVAKITVADAHTYVSNGVLSHNAKA